MPQVWTHTIVVCTTSGVIVSALLVARGRSTSQEMSQAVAVPDVEVLQVERQDGPRSNAWMCMHSDSSSLTFVLYQPEEAAETALATGIIARMGLSRSRLRMRTAATAPALDAPGDVPNHALAVHEARAALDTVRLPGPDAMGHRAVYGDTDHAPRRL